MQSPPLRQNINGGGAASFKRLVKPPQLPINLFPGHVYFRLLCHASRIGGIIGKSGSIIKQLQQETSTKIRIEDSFPNKSDDDYRVIVIIGSASVIRRVKLNANQQDYELNGNDDEFLVDVSAAQEAVVRVFERVIEVAAESDGVIIQAGGFVSCRLLAQKNQVGSVIGKGGNVVEKIKKDTGCKIKVLSFEKLQPCADEMVEIEGDLLGVKRALVAVTSCLQDCATAIEKARMVGSRQHETVTKQTLPNPQMDFPPHRISMPQPMVTSSSNYVPGGPSPSVEGDRSTATESRLPQLEVVYKILCLNDKVGGVIGKGGSIIRTLQAETGASINIGPTIAECDERLITITAIESPDSRQTAAQNAALRVFDRLIDIDPEKGATCLRLVVSPNQAGCLLGKGGAIISEMRKITGTSIRIIGGDQLPKCVLENDEVVQITGEFGNVRHALHNVTGRLRDNLHTTKPPPSFINGSSPYPRARDPSQMGFHPPIGIPQSLSQHSTLTQSMENLGLSQNVNRPPSLRPLTSQMVPRANQMSGTEAKGLTSVKGGVELGSGSRSAFVTNTTIEIVVPENVIGSVYGENGCNLVRLRQISGAKVTVHEPRPGTTDRILIISGSPDETHAARSLLQAFILTGSS